MKLLIFSITLALSCNESGDFQYSIPKHEVEKNTEDANPDEEDNPEIYNAEGDPLPPSAKLQAFLEKHGLGLEHALDDYNNLWDKKGKEWTKDNGVANPTKTFSFTFSQNAITETVTLEKEIKPSPGKIEIGRQIERREDTLGPENQPGTVAPSIERDIEQNQLGILDILLVIDSSGSMSGEQTQMMNNLESLLSQVTHTDWQIKVVNTDPNCKSSETITVLTPDYENVYKTSINVGTSGGTEYALWNARKSLEGNCDGKKAWVRPDSSIAMIVVTDEGHQCPSDKSSSCSLSAFTTYFQGLRSSGKAKAYGLVANHNWGNVFSQHDNVAADSYGDILAKLSDNIKAHLESEFDLQHKPDGAVTVSVRESSSASFVQRASTEFSVKEVPEDSGDYRLIFDKGYVPPDGSTIRISYSYLDHEFQSSWTLEFEPLEESGKLIFTVTKDDGTETVLTSKQYTVNGKVISVSTDDVQTLVPQGSSVHIRYREDKDLKRTFSLTGAHENDDIILDSVVVTVDGVKQTGGYTFYPSNNTLTFTNAPAENAVIKIAYKHITGNKLRYDIIGSGITDINCYDGTRQVNSCYYSNGEVVFVEGDFRDDDFVDGKQIKVVQSIGDNRLILDENFIPETVTLTIDGQTCEYSDIVINNQQVMLNMVGDCPKLQDLLTNRGKNIEVSYTIRTIQQDHIKVPDEFFTRHEDNENNEDNYKLQFWAVAVNGKEMEMDEDFTIKNNRVKFIETLPSDSVVKVSVWLFRAL